MLKKIKNKNNMNKTESISKFKSLPKSKKVYSKGKIFKDLRVGMREVSLEDKEIDKLIVYDTSGCYSDKTIHMIMKKVLPK